MNERIEKLLAELDIDLYTDKGVMMTGILVRPKDLRQFAELSVKECSKVCNDVGVAIFAEPVQNNFGTAQTCKLAIEKHFGVEE
jgi:hypothetical protein